MSTLSVIKQYMKIIATKLKREMSAMNKKFPLIYLLLTVPSLAFSHATFENKSVTSGAYYKGVIGIGHGCQGSTTTRITVEIPEGVQRAKPMPKPNWNVDVVKEKLSVPYTAYGKKYAEDVRKIIWSGGGLLDQNFDEFTFRAKIAVSPQTLYFPTRQECVSGEIYWHEIPAVGKNAHDYKSPAPSLKVLKGSAHHH
ncbi:MAG: YcnI family protein [Gammaproteobacteria bacterium]|nr:YcnI family protein [Gammaproteobacteria bacterium]